VDCDHVQKASGGVNRLDCCFPGGFFADVFFPMSNKNGRALFATTPNCLSASGYPSEDSLYIVLTAMSRHESWAVS